MKGRWVDLGRLGYREAWDIQLEAADEVLAGGDDTIFFVEHNPVFTLGANFHAENLLAPPEELERQGFEVVKTDRGGDVTYHGPGQLTIYPIFNLERHGKDLHRWLRALEETQLEVLRHFGIEGRRFSPHTGVWVEDRKVSAIGIKVRRWVSLHGVATNCAAQIQAFERIIPCGIRQYGVTSLTELVGREITPSDLIPVQLAAFSKVCGLEFDPLPLAAPVSAESG